MSARVAWQFYDPVLDITERMEINPNDGASPEYKKNISKKTTSVGAPLIFEGADDLSQFAFSGAILTEGQYNFLKNAWNKRYIIQITDDLGRVLRVYIESFSPKRKHSHKYPWRHDYSASAILVEEIS